MIKGFIFDIDGTLYDRKLQLVPASTFNALKQLRQKGYKIAVCTAREKGKLKTVPHELLEYFDVVVTSLGAMAYKDYYLYWSNLIKQEDLDKYVDYMDEHNMSYSYTLEDGKTYYWGNIDYKKIKRILDWSARMPMMKKISKDMKVANFEIIDYKEEDYEYLCSVNPNVEPVKWPDNAVFTAEGVDKSTGIDMFCDAYGFSKEEIVAFGDGSFDAKMLEYAGVGIAMKDSSEELIKSADYVCDKSLLDGGIYEMLVKLGYIERYKPDIKIIFFDIDSTTFDHSIKDVRESTLIALRKLKEKEIKLAFATSRAPEEMFNVPKKLSDLMDGYVGCAGAYTVFNGEVIAKVITDPDLPECIKYLEDNNLTYRYVLEDGKGYLNKHDEKIEKLFFDLYHMTPPIKKYEGENMVHLLYYTEDKLQKSKVDSILKESSHLHYILPNEAMAPDTDKSSDMLRLAKRLGFEKENVAAFGDSFNDVDMLKTAELGICMGNGRDVVKLAADYVTDDISAEGLYNALKVYGYID